ncbi:MAG: tetratricopeptide repeat protein [Firmicutes bacterium]|nr:tetratricopeptide repeat protein [Bacillota bacterium]
MKKPLKVIFIILAAVVYLAIPLFWVWGTSIQTAQANYRFITGDYPGARDLYIKLAESNKASPEARFNLGLSLYQLGQYGDAYTNFNQALSIYPAPKPPRDPAKGPRIFRPDPVSGGLHYQLGNARWKLAAKQADQPGSSPPEAIVKGYQEALEHYQKALRANPGDFDAKYNYELTLLRLGQYQPPSEPPPQNLRQEEDYLSQLPPVEPPANGKDW